MSNIEINPIIKFIEDIETFKKSPKYQTMPSELRDFLNEEIGRFKMVSEIMEDKENDR